MPNVIIGICIFVLIVSCGLYIIAETSRDMEQKIILWKVSFFLFVFILQLSIQTLHLDDNVLFLVIRGVAVVFTAREGYNLLKKITL